MSITSSLTMQFLNPLFSYPTFISLNFCMQFFTSSWYYQPKANTLVVQRRSQVQVSPQFFYYMFVFKSIVCLILALLCQFCARNNNDGKIRCSFTRIWDYTIDINRRANLVQWGEPSYCVTRSWVRSSLRICGGGLPQFIPFPDPLMWESPTMVCPFL